MKFRPSLSLILLASLLAALLGLVVPLQVAHASSTWSSTTSMSVARGFHTATLLPNGKVLVAGGEDFSTNTPLASAELYDPITSSWSSTTSMSVARVGHTATLLPNGKVLVAGGFGNILGDIHLASAELYDPITGSWSSTASMSVARAGHKATLLSNGQVLVAGGVGNSDTILASAELYDPITGSWTLTGSMSVARFAHTATLLSNGQVLVAGGDNSSGFLSSAELYDPSTSSWSSTASMSVVRFLPTAILLPNGKVLVAGGVVTSSTLASAELYDPSTSSWSSTASMNVARGNYPAILLPNGQVLVAGGFTFNNTTLASAELFSLDTTPPVLSLPTSPITVDATSPAGAVVTYPFSATDPDDLSSQLTINCTPASGSTFPIGTTTVNCTASDPAGNTVSGSFQVTVKGAAQQVSDLINLVNSFHLSSNLQTALDNKLQDVLTAINAGQTATACSELTDFIGFVQSHTGKGISTSQAQTLITAAKQIQAVLGC